MFGSQNKIARIYILTAFFSVLFFPFSSSSQVKPNSFSFSNLKQDNLHEITGWKFTNGDNLNYALYNFNDRNWEILDSIDTQDIDQKLNFNSIVWFRSTIYIDSTVKSIPLFLLLFHQGASQLFIDGKLLRSFGNPSKESNTELTINPRRIPVSILFKESGKHVIAVRYSNHQSNITKLLFNQPDYGMNVYVGLNNSEFTDYYTIQSIYTTGFQAIFGFLLALSVLHLLIYFFYKEQRSNLRYSLFTFSLAIFILLFELSSHASSPLIVIASNYFTWRVGVLTFFLLLKLVYSIVYTEVPKKLNRYTNLIGTFFLAVLFLFPFLSQKLFYAIIVLTITTACTITGTLITGAIKRKMEGIRMIGYGFLTFIYIAGIYYISISFFNLKYNPNSTLGTIVFCVLAIGVLSIPFSMSVYLAFSFAKTNKFLKLKLQQVENLSAINLEQERERKRLIESQKDNLEIEVKLRTAEVVAQKEELGNKNKEIIDSITYAKRLQQAILPPFDLIGKHIPHNFILYLPKDIVAGDFYWFHHTESEIYIAAADSTGHGVPGAMVSIVCSNALEKAVKEFNLKMPGEILDKTTDLVLETFSKSGEEIKDGMDISLLCIRTKEQKVFWSGANNPLWYISNEKLIEIKANKQPVGKSDHRKPFTTHQIEYNVGDLFYLFTDGYPDQFGGEKGKKFKYGQLSDLLLYLSLKDMSTQKSILTSTFNDWKDKLEQVDDVCIIGLKI